MGTEAGLTSEPSSGLTGPADSRTILARVRAGDAALPRRLQTAYDDDLNDLEDGLRRLKVEYDIFFNGHRKRPPDDLRMRVEKLVKKLSEAGGMSFAQRFRYNTIVARFYVMRDLWRRTMQQRESGAGQEARPSAPGGQPPAKGAGASAAREEVRISISDPGREEEKIRRLYEAILEMRGRQAAQPPRVSYQQFARYISDQTQKIQGKWGCSSVQFAISLDEDAIRFTARAAEDSPRDAPP